MLSYLNVHGVGVAIDQFEVILAGLHLFGVTSLLAHSIGRATRVLSLLDGKRSLVSLDWTHGSLSVGTHSH